jgi:type II secretion system protein G
MKKQTGFTLIELLVVMAILGILATVGLSSFRSSQLKSRDAKRKSDLEQVQRALEMYHNDYGRYPESEGGKIKIGGSALTWGGAEMTDGNTLYMKELPGDPTGNPEYCYVFEAGPPAIGYKLYAKLENSQDPHCIGGICSPPSADCGGLTKAYNYGVTSSNLEP